MRSLHVSHAGRMRSSSAAPLPGSHRFPFWPSHLATLPYPQVMFGAICLQHTPTIEPTHWRPHSATPPALLVMLSAICFKHTPTIQLPYWRSHPATLPYLLLRSRLANSASSTPRAPPTAGSSLLQSRGPQRVIFSRCVCGVMLCGAALATFGNSWAGGLSNMTPFAMDWHTNKFTLARPRGPPVDPPLWHVANLLHPLGPTPSPSWPPAHYVPPRTFSVHISGLLHPLAPTLPLP